MSVMLMEYGILGQMSALKLQEESLQERIARNAYAVLGGFAIVVGQSLERRKANAKTITQFQPYVMWTLDQ